MPLTDPGFVQRLREWFATVQPAAGARLWDIKSEDTARSWISQAVMAAARDAQDVTGFVCDASRAAPSAAEGDPDADGA